MSRYKFGAAIVLLLLSVAAIPKAVSAAGIDLFGNANGALATATDTVTINATTLALSLTTLSEPASMLLLGTVLLTASRARRRKAPLSE